MNKNIKSKVRLYQNLLYAIVFILVFEGIFRKLVPTALSSLIFFSKDIVCLFVLLVFIRNGYDKTSSSWFQAWNVLLIFFVPCLINTALYDPALVFFGLKQYLLYYILLILVPNSFPSGFENDLKKFILFFTLLIIPTTIVAIFQNSLPSSNWLNRGVGGSNLEGFSAGGFLRVSSTFSFTAQYSYFLNVVTAIYFLYFFTNKSSKLKNIAIKYTLGLLLITGTFITGGRTSVMGGGLVILMGFSFIFIKNSFKNALRLGFIILGFIGFFFLIRTYNPNLFAAYETRSKGFGGQSQTEELYSRVSTSFTGLNHQSAQKSIREYCLGEGLGVMSNGAEKISQYAYIIRKNGFWTETDFATSTWEGGVYLLIIWYGFRLFLMVYCIKVWRRIKNINISNAISFLVAYVIYIGAIGTLGIQPPLAIWWFLSIGLILTFSKIDQNANRYLSFN